MTSGITKETYLPVEYDTYIVPENTPAIDINYMLRDYPRVKTVGDQLWDPGKIVVPPHRMLVTEAVHWIARKSAGGPLITVDSDGWVDGPFGIQSNGYAGDGIYFPGGTSRQKVNKVFFSDHLGLCMNLGEPEAGHECNITGVQAQRSDRTQPGILMPYDEKGIRGIRRIEDCQGGGGRLIELRNCNVTLMDECSTLGDLGMGDDCRQCVIEKCRLAVPQGTYFTIKGHNHIIMQNQISAPAYLFGSGSVFWNYDGGRYMMPGATAYTVLGMGNTPKTVDWSGAPNMIIF